jgi:hypothetical protein
MMLLLCMRFGNIFCFLFFLLFYGFLSLAMSFSIIVVVPTPSSAVYRVNIRNGEVCK